MDQKWRVTFKRLPDETIIDGITVLASTKEKAKELWLMGLCFANLRNKEVKEIEIVSCTKII